MAHADLDHEHLTTRIIVTTMWNERELIKQVPGARWNSTAKNWSVPLTWESCIVLRGVFADALTIGDSLNAWAWTERRRIDYLMQLRDRLEPDFTHVDDRRYPFQAAGAEFLELAREAILGDEMGTGKTIQALTAAVLPVVVVCPNSVKRSWETHTTQWRPDAVPYVVSGGAVGREKILKQAAGDPNAVVIVNYESTRLLSRLSPYGSTRLRRCRTCDPKHGEDGLTASRCQVHPKTMNTIPFRTVIIDEAHRIKSAQSQVTRAVWAVAHQGSVQRRFALTGTPLANHPGELWAVLHAISPVAFPTKTHFVDRYCLQSWNAYGGLDIVGLNPGTRDEFFKLLDPRFRRMTKAQVLPMLPPKVRDTRWVELTPAQRKLYDRFENDLVVDVPGGTIAADDPLFVRMRQMQLSSASVIMEGEDIRLREPSCKVDELEAILEELGPKQVVVCAQSRQLIDLAAVRLTKLRISHGLITGPVSETERRLTLEAFQDGKIQVLLFTVAAGGVGLTMTAADTIIFLQRSWSMIDNKQAEDRVHRIGSEQHASIHIIDVVARDTREEDQIGSLTQKMLRLEEITRDRAHADAISHAALNEEEAQILGSEL